MKHLFLQDGTPIFSLQEIPMDQDVLRVSQKPLLTKSPLNASYETDGIWLFSVDEYKEQREKISLQTQAYMKSKEEKAKELLDKE